MNTPKFINFKKQRDLGDIISDSFAFIRENWKGYFSSIAKIAGIPFIIAIVASGFYMSSFVDIIDKLNGNTPKAESFFAIGGFVLIAILAGIIFYVLMQMSALFYIKSYINNNGSVNFEEIKENVKNNFWKFLGFSILMMLVVGLGTLFCVLPGVYLGVVLSLGTSILVFENKTVGDTFSYCFTLIKDHWLETFGCVLVIGLLVAILSQAFSIPALIYQFVKTATISKQNDPTAILGIFKDPVYLALTVFSYAGQFLLSSVTLISGVFIYFDLNEQKNATGAIETIENLGNN